MAIKMSSFGKNKIVDTAFELDWDNAEDIAVQTQYQADRAGLITFRGNNTSDWHVAIVKWGPNMDGSSSNGNYFTGDTSYAPANEYIVCSLIVAKGEYYMVQVKSGTSTAYAKFIPFKNSIANS